MPDPREVLAAALAEQSPDDDDLRDWLTDRAEFVEDALAAAGIHLCTEGQAVVDGQVVTLFDRGETVVPCIDTTGYTRERRYAVVEAPDAR